MGRPFTNEQDEWLRDHHSPDKTIRSITNEFNLFFNERRTVDVIKVHCRILGLKQKNMQKFSDEEDAWLLRHCREMSYKETTKLFNETFNANRSCGVIKVHCNRELGVGFKNDHGRNGCDIGTEKVRHGFVYVKVSDIRCKKTGAQSTKVNWKPKAQVVWEQHYGKLLPKGYTIVFLDRNHFNLDIKNIYAVDGRVLREMTKRRWFSDDPNLTLAAIKWCELFYKVKDVMRGES